MKRETVIDILFILGFILLSTLILCSNNSDVSECVCHEVRGDCKCRFDIQPNDSQDKIEDGKSQVFGIDVSHHNGIIDWKVLSSKQELAFVYVKATEGATYVDKNYFKNVEGASAAGYRVGSYHFFRMTSSAHDQFKNFDKTIRGTINQKLIPMVDVETNDKHPISELRDSLNVFISLIKDKYGVYPMIYGTNKSYNTYCGKNYNKYHLYIGRYGKNAPVIKGSGHYTIWQYSESGKLPGIPKPVDLAKLHPEYTINDISLPN